MSAGIPLRVIAAAMAAMERALDDDRAGRVKLPTDTYMALLRASGNLEINVCSLGIVLPVAEEQEQAHG